MMESFASYIGVPFKEKGRDRDGWDCWGLVRYGLMDVFGVYVPSYEDEYKSTKHRGRITAKIDEERRNWKLVEGEPRPGDVVLLRMAGLPMHVGLVVCHPRMLHVEVGVETVIEDYTSTKWKERVTGVYRHADM